MTDLNDIDPQETQEWRDSLDAVVAHDGTARGNLILNAVLDRARRLGARPDLPLNTDYVNTIPVSETPPYPGDEGLERRIRRINRWNAAVMVGRANKYSPGIGGHMSTFASAATLYDVGFHHFFRGPDAEGGGDQVYIQGHTSPGIYARAFLEGRISESQLERFRREVDRGKGLSSYPHPRLMPDFWEFPTVSMGLGPLSAIYQARFNRYLEARGIKDTSKQRVWAFLGDGETDEPESLGSLSIAARENLGNLTFVINCNLQRLDGPVRGNGKIVQELERVFRGTGWNVIKCLWGRDWDPIFAKDTEHALVDALNVVVDGEWQKYGTESGAYTRNNFFGQDPRMLKLVEDIPDEKILRLRRGGHDPVKIHAAYQAAVESDRPTCILAHTVKGWTLGEGFEASNVTHQMKKLTEEQMKRFRDRLELPISDDDVRDSDFYHPGPKSEEVQYLEARRRELGGPIPSRRVQITVDQKFPGNDLYQEFSKGSAQGRGVSTTMAFVRLLSKLLKDESVGRHIVPIVPDEARTFGMDSFFRQVGIYASGGQKYEPIDRNVLLYYRETADGQLLEEGITEAGAMASFTAAGTAYSTHGVPMIPFYIFYSMFGFQRTGDSIWAFGDQRGRGFLLGATAGRTSLNGEGLQHEDGHSHVLASTVPNVRAYDPAFAYEIAMIVQDGLERMFVNGEDCFYYITLQNDNYDMPAMPEGDGVRQGIIDGLYRFRPAAKNRKLKVQLFGSGTIINNVLEAQTILDERYKVAADVWSATGYKQLRQDALSCERWNRLHPESEPKLSKVETILKGVAGPFIAASDYMKIVPEQIQRWLPGRLVPLGTDGYGMSDSREALRRHFEVDAASIVIAALDGLRLEGKVEAKVVAQAIRDLEFDADKIDPLTI